VAALAFCPAKKFNSKGNLWAKTRAEHGTNRTEEKQTLLSKTRENLQSKTAL
jgi:hypothetical protein